MFRRAIDISIFISAILVHLFLFRDILSYFNKFIESYGLFFITLYIIYTQSAIRDRVITTASYGWLWRHIVIWVGRDWPIQVFYLILYDRDYINLLVLMELAGLHLTAHYLYYEILGPIVKNILWVLPTLPRRIYWPIVMLLPALIYFLICLSC